MMVDDRYQSGRFVELLNYALNPAKEHVIEELFNAGFESGETFSGFGALIERIWVADM